MITKINNKKWSRILMTGVFCCLLTPVSCLLSSCNEEPDGSNLFSSDQKTIAEMLRERSELSAFYRILQKGKFD